MASINQDPLKMDKMRKQVVRKSDEVVYYDSAKAKRSWLGKFHYCMSCPGWNKATDSRILYSRWEEKSECCGYRCGFTVPWGRQLDTFDSDIVVDLSAHQSCFQICRGEGDIVVWRLEGGDLSSDEEMFAMTDIPGVYNLYSTMTLQLSKMNLKSAAMVGLGTRMGAVVWNYDARSGANGPAEATNDPLSESLFYDSVEAERTALGRIFHHDCCMPPIYKITSERLMYVDWDFWYACDEPYLIPFVPFYVLRACFRDMCCGFGSGTRNKAKDALKKRKEDKEKNTERSCIARCCACPIGRTANFMDIDLVADVGAHQRCSQLCLNEGDLLLHVLPGDASGDADENGIFSVTQVPEVFASFDDLSFQLSQMNLKNFRQNAIAQQMR